MTQNFIEVNQNSEKKNEHEKFIAPQKFEDTFATGSVVFKLSKKSLFFKGLLKEYSQLDIFDNIF